MAGGSRAGKLHDAMLRPSSGRRHKTILPIKSLFRESGLVGGSRLFCALFCCSRCIQKRVENTSLAPTKQDSQKGVVIEGRGCFADMKSDVMSERQPPNIDQGSVLIGRGWGFVILPSLAYCAHKRGPKHTHTHVHPRPNRTLQKEP